MSINPTLKFTTVSYKNNGGAPSNNTNGNDDSSYGMKDGTSSSGAAGVANKKKSKKIGTDHFDATSSILSDYDGLELEDDASSYILFNPIRSPVQSSHRHESDILSLTNTTNTQENAYESEEEEEDEEDEDEGIEDDDEDYSRAREWNRPLDSTIRDGVSNLSNKINSWYQSSITDHAFVDDNIASWNVDENIMGSSKETVTSKEETADVNTNTNKLLLKQFYGDELFKYLNQDEIEKFDKFHNLIDIKKFLLEKDENTPSAGSSSALSQLIYKILLLNKKNSATAASIDSHAAFTGYAGMTDYVNYMNNASVSKKPSFVQPTTFSETTGGSSLILCGGVGFGGSASWNDI